MPRRLQRKRSKGWRAPEGAIYVGRPGKWGNPYRARLLGGRAVVQRWLDPRKWSLGGWVTVAAKADLPQAKRYALKLFREEMTREDRIMARRELRGHDLLCWCALGDYCHGDLWLKVANS